MVCAVDDEPVGIDVEVININLDIAKKIFSEDEYDKLMNQPQKNRLIFIFIRFGL